MDTISEHVKALEEEFANRYTAEDNQYNLALTEEDHIPPVLTNWTDQRRNRRSDERDRGRFDRQDRSNDRPRENRDRYNDRSREDRGRYDRRPDGRDEYGSSKKPRYDDHRNEERNYRR